ncbi:MAG: protein-L-isoaspartate O-methyltransferase [Alphaproteobacteria bacterium]|nr:protein-L-isoaspartate O-methyltransferase [Alphaproteobacteria bacterium]
MPRERFVPRSLAGIAYVDEDLDLGNGRHLMEPAVLARMIEALAPKAHETALIVGAGSGYEAAVLGRLVAAVVAVEVDAIVVAQASRLLGELAVDNVVVEAGPLTNGCPDHAPYEVILLSGAVPEVPPALTAQLASGGRLAAVVSHGDGIMGRACLFVKSRDTVSRRELFDAGTPLLPGFAPAPAFVF